jgi:outer membrane lipoprotein-sorting protein
VQRRLTAVAVGSMVLACAAIARAQPEAPGADEIVQRMNDRDEGTSLTRTLVMELIDKDGTTRTRSLRAYRRQVGPDRRAVLFFDEPPAVKGTAFLSWDYGDPARDDDQWLYLPELRKTRRIALAERGRAFLGTDLSFEDMRKETKLEGSDYRWQSAGEETVDGARCWVVEGVAVDEATARETGYGRLRLRVDAASWMPRFLEYWDPAGAPLKTIRLRDIEQVDGLWTARRIEAANEQTGHQTRIRFEQVDFRTDVSEELLTEAAMRRGTP